jgi:hypothetical protein
LKDKRIWDPNVIIAYLKILSNKWLDYETLSTTVACRDCSKTCERWYIDEKGGKAPSYRMTNCLYDMAEYNSKYLSTSLKTTVGIIGFVWI